MKKRRLGRSNLDVSALGMGCFAIGGPFKGSNGNYYAYSDVSEETAIETIHRAIDLGINFFDTADIYGLGRSERLLGKALVDYQDDIVIATKFANSFDEQKKIAKGKNVESDYIRSAVDASLNRLQVDVIDLYQLHASQLEEEKALDVRNTLEDLVSDGKIRYYGWSTDDPIRAKIFAEGKHCTGIQYILSLFYDNKRMLELCKKHDLASIIRSPLHSGTLTGKYKDGSIKLPENHMLHKADFSSERNLQVNDKLTRFGAILSEDGRTLAQGALAYLWTTSEMTIPIPGAKSVKQIEENAKTIELGPLTSDQINHINEIFSDMKKDSFLDNPYYQKKG